MEARPSPEPGGFRTETYRGPGPLSSLGDLVGPPNTAVIIGLVFALNDPGSRVGSTILRQPRNLLPPWSWSARIPGSGPRAPDGFRNTASVFGPAGNCQVRNSMSKPSYVVRLVTVTTGGPPRSTGAMHSRARLRAACRHSSTLFHLPVRNDKLPDHRLRLGRQAKARSCRLGWVRAVFARVPAGREKSRQGRPRCSSS